MSDQTKPTIGGGDMFPPPIHHSPSPNKDDRPSDQPKPRKQDAAAPTCEWTAIDAQGLLVRGWQGIADAHNAALTASERENTSVAQQAAFSEGIRADEIARQLAAEREKVQTLVELANFFKSVIQSGEPWTATCQKQYTDALAKVGK